MVQAPLSHNLGCLETSLISLTFRSTRSAFTGSLNNVYIPVLPYLVSFSLALWSQDVLMAVRCSNSLRYCLWINFSPPFSRCNPLLHIMGELFMCFIYSISLTVSFNRADFFICFNFGPSMSTAPRCSFKLICFEKSPCTAQVSRERTSPSILTCTT